MVHQKFRRCATHRSADTNGYSEVPVDNQVHDLGARDLRHYEEERKRKFKDVCSSFNLAHGFWS